MAQLTFREQLEKHNQPDEVRQRLAAGEYGSPNDAIAQEYLASVDRKAAEASSSKRDAREEETLAIAKSANRMALWAMIAAVIAAAAAIASAIIAAIALK